ncbi:MAG: TIGR02099 family protein [Immundisolibacter sp.]|uniref:YhdP family protein n=1 Tax=Immundisolibacter sp. TaxID=1934948 RepID=UPI00199C8EA4|nr:YhdP family protein [Immundisolibacter sp.]MBC7161985.1 TIGR02099 family protein [Immundisolibacter sp.]
MRVLIGRLRRLLAWTVFALLVLAAAGLSALRVLLPQLEQRPQQVAAVVSRVLGQPVQFSDLSAGLRGNTPEISLRSASLLGSDGSVTRVAALSLRFNWLASLLAWEPRLAALQIEGLHLAVVRQPDGRWQVGGMQVGEGGGDGLSSWLLAQPQVRLRAAVIDVTDLTQAGRMLRLEPADVTLQRRGARHWLDLRVGVGGAASGSFRLRAEMGGLAGDMATTDGRAYVTAREVVGAGVPLGPFVFGGELNGELWLRWKEGRVTRVHGSVDGRGELQRADAQTGLVLDALHLSGVMQRAADGWMAGLDSLRAESGERLWRLDRALLRRSGDTLALTGGLIDLPRFGPLAALMAPSQNALATRLAGADPTLRGRDLLLIAGSAGTTPGPLRLAVRVDELGWQPDGALPGLAGAAGELRLGEAAASFTLVGSPHLLLDAPRAYAEPLQLDAAQGELTAQWSPSGVDAQLGGFSARRGSIALAARGRLSLPAGGEPELFLQAGTPQAAAAEFFALLPDRGLSPKFIEWGRKAIQAGTLSDVQALLRGDPRRFPFRDGQGQFLGTARFVDVGLDYQPGAGWPAVAEARGQFGLRGAEFSLSLDEGRLLDSRASAVQVRIPDVALPSKRLLLDGVVDGPAQDVIRFVQQSPLASRFGGRVERLAFDGTAQTRVKLDLVFTGPVKSTQVSGRTQLAGNALTIAGSGLTVQQLRGALTFDQRGLGAKAVQARLFGGPVVFDLASAPGSGLRVEPRGQADAAQITRYLRLPWPELFAGAVPWQGGIDIAGAGDLDLDLNLDLAKATGELPAPLDALRSQPLHVRAQCACGAPPRAWDVTLSAQPLTARLDLAPVAGGGTALRRGDLAIGVETRLPPAGFNVHGRLAQLPLAPWLAWLGQHFGGAAGGAWPAPRVDVYADRLDYLGQSFAGVRLQVLRSEGWDIDLDAVDVAGKVNVRGSGPTQAVGLDLSRLYLQRQDGAGEGGSGGVNPASVPVLGGRIGALRYGGEDFGALEFSSQRLADGLDFDRLDLRGEYGTIGGRGRWTGTAQRAESHLDATADFKDFGAFLARFGVADLVRGGRGKVQAQVSWPGSPGAFGFAMLSGQVSGQLQKGTLPDVEPGVGRLFGILSLDSVMRRLSLDFRDVFGRGFAIDRTDGELQLAAGDAELRDLRVRGPAAHLTLNGHTNLVDRSLDLQVLVVPQVTSSLPLAGAIAAPGVGAVIYLGQKIFEGAIDKATEQHYRVTGTWAEPKIDKR